MTISGKKILKIVAWIALVAGLVMLALIAYAYYQYEGKYEVDKTKYPNQVGYINPDTAILTDGFTLCGDGYIMGHYSSAAPYIYNGNKELFRRRIMAGYKNQGYQDSGYLNLRFLINCDGKVGKMEVNQLDRNLDKTLLDENLVKQLVQLTSNKENWDTDNQSHIENANYYMYVLFKIEDGAITEILP